MQKPGASTAEVVTAFQNRHPGLCAKHPDWREVVVSEVRLMKRFGGITFSHELNGWVLFREKPKALLPRDMMPEAPPSYGPRTVSGGLPSLGKRR